MPTKTWAQGEEVAAADMNSYLQRQVVSTFASSAARDLALPAPVQGQIVYIADIQRLEYWNGTAWSVVTSRVTGRVKQTVTQGINNNTDTVIPMGASDFLVGGMALVSNGLRVPVSGVYSIVGTIGSLNGAGNSGVAGMFQTTIWGTTLGALVKENRYSTGFFYASSVSVIYAVPANDILTISMYTNGGVVYADPTNGNGMPATLSATLVSA